jgi:crossover junction endodeoxyribonuclease RusA
VTPIELYVHGHPAPQGSKRHVGRGIMVEASKRVQPWREAVVGEAIRAGWNGTGLDEPLTVDLAFYFTRPQSHYGKSGVKQSAPHVPARRSVGDIDKLVRSTLDALVQASVMSDDCLVVLLTARKRYATLVRPAGARIRIDLHRGVTDGNAE